KTHGGRKLQTSALNQPVSEAVGDSELVLPDGASFHFGVLTWPTEAGPKESVLWDMLSQTWCLRYAIQHPDEYRKGMSSATAKAEGIRRDGPFLRSLGVTKLLSPVGAVLSLDEAQRRWEYQIGQEIRP